ncbi:MAG: adenosylmethionine--8-amino-7-oxononanoate transaminase [Nitrospiria bacterium]
MKKYQKNKWLEKGRSFIWHPFTQMREWENEDPTIIVEGKGTTLVDLEGKRYLDGTSSIWVNLHGHRHPTIDAALKRQLNKIAHSTLLGLSNQPAIALAEKLIALAPSSAATPQKNLAKVFYSDDGSTAVEIAVKIAFGYWQNKDGRLKKKRKFICFTHAYHGDTIGSVSLGGIDLFHESYRPLLFETIKVPAPTCYRCPLSLDFPSCALACVDEVEKAMKKYHRVIAGLVIEPLVQAAAGMLTAPPGYLIKIRALCDRYDILMIADEVATGFGRTGKMFACEYEDVVPDIMALSKGITGGYLPLAATLATQEIYDAYLGQYEDFKAFFHGHSYTGNPLGCAAAIANLEVFKKERTLQKMQPKIAYAKKALAPWKRWQNVGEIRQVGLMIGIELVARKTGKIPYPLEMRIGHQVCREAKAQGVLLRPLGNVIVLMPALSISMQELKKLISMVGLAIKKVTSRKRRRIQNGF